MKDSEKGALQSPLKGLSAGCHTLPLQPPWPPMACRTEATNISINDKINHEYQFTENQNMSRRVKGFSIEFLAELKPPYPMPDHHPQSILWQST